MNEQRFDDLTRWLAGIDPELFSRRAFLRRFALGAAGAAMAGGRLASVAAQATPAATPAASGKIRQPGGPSIEQVAFDLAYDPEAIFRFVRDEVRYHSYPGVLRGAKGTLWGMAGNSADQALLLAALLKESLVETRFVVGELDAAGANDLLGAAAVDLAALRADAQRLLDSDATAPNATPPTLTAEQQNLLDRAQALRPTLLTTAKTQRDATLAALADGLRQAGIALAAPQPQLPDRERRQHIWLQYAAGPDWIDLDPSMPGAQPGQARAKSSATLNALPDEAHHQIALRVVAEIANGGQPTRQAILSYQAKSADLVGSTITFFQSKPQWIGAAINEAIGGQVQYNPYLVIDDQVTKGTGTLAFGAAGGAASALGSANSVEGEPIGEWIEIDVVVPDEQPQTETREIFDRIGIDRRTPGADLSSAIAALPPAELVDVPGAGATFVPLIGATSVAVVSSSVPSSYFQQDYAIADQNADFALQNHGFHLLRDVLHAEMAAETGLRFFHDRPNITLFRIGAANVTADSATLVAGLDLVHASLAGRPLKGAAPPSPAGLVDGAINQAAERGLYETGAAAFQDLVTPTFTNVGRLFEEAARQGIALHTVTPGSTLPAEIAGAISGPARTRIEEALATGFAVVVPARAVPLNGSSRSGWWQIDPTTGRTFDRMDDGRGAEGAEEAVLVEEAIEGVSSLYHLTSCIVSIGVVAGVVIFAAAGGTLTNGSLALATGAGVHGFAHCAAAIVGA